MNFETLNQAVAHARLNRSRMVFPLQDAITIAVKLGLIQPDIVQYLPDLAINDVMVSQPVTKHQQRFNRNLEVETNTIGNKNSNRVRALKTPGMDDSPQRIKRVHIKRRLRVVNIIRAAHQGQLKHCPKGRAKLIKNGNRFELVRNNVCPGSRKKQRASRRATAMSLLHRRSNPVKVLLNIKNRVIFKR